MTIARTAMIYLWVIAATLVFALTAILVSFFSKTGDAVHLVARIWGRSLLWGSTIPVTLKGVEHIDPARSCIFMSNHQSNFDIPVLLSGLPAQFRWLAKAELFKIPIFGRGMRGAGYISIDRSDRRSAFASLARAAKTIREGTSVMIFPEGTRSAHGTLLPFKKGGFVLAVDAGVPVVPLVIQGTWSIMPKTGWLIRPQPVSITLLEPIQSSDYTRKTKNDLMERVRQAMLAALTPVADPEAGGERHA